MASVVRARRHGPRAESGESRRAPLPSARRRDARQPRDPDVDVRCGGVRSDAPHVTAAGVLGVGARPARYSPDSGWCRQPLLSHNSAVNSKIHPKYKTKYRVGNWQAYERALVQRGDITLWLSANAIDAWRPGLSGLPGGPRKYSNVSIETALTLRLIFHLPLRQTEGFLRSILALM